jgi:myo-inositol 2-dehydrogenase / D-chiro-inositol 1-dehydrogenase
MITNICLVGAGRAGNFHAESIMRHKGINLAMIVDSNKKKGIEFATNYNTVHYESLSYVLTDLSHLCNAVIIATTTPTHYDLVMLSLKANKHVLCEKPLGTTEQIKECYQLANDQKLHLLIGFQKRFDNNYRALLQKTLLTKSSLPHHIRFVTRDYPVPSSQYLSSSNGIVEDMLSHDIDQAYLFMNGQTPKKVIAFNSTELDVLKNINEIEHITVMMQYAKGQIITIEGSRTADYGYDQRVEVFTGDKPNKVIQMNNVLNSTVETYSRQGIILDEINESFPQRYTATYLYELEYFINMINENIDIQTDKLYTDLNAMLYNVNVCHAINKSIATGKVIYL